VDGGEGLQIWRVAANMLNKQLQLQLPTIKKNNTLRNVTKGLGFGWMLWNDLSHGKWA
jgi:hypothetical protein